jgi:hypothetical protein
VGEATTEGTKDPARKNSPGLRVVSSLAAANMKTRQPGSTCSENGRMSSGKMIVRIGRDVAVSEAEDGRGGGVAVEVISAALPMMRRLYVHDALQTANGGHSDLKPLDRLASIFLPAAV